MATHGQKSVIPPQHRRLRAALLMDFYGNLLTSRQQDVLTLMVDDDFSLAEIASHYGISRQGAFSLVAVAEEKMLTIEAKTGLLRRFADIPSDILAILPKSER